MAAKRSGAEVMGRCIYLMDTGFQLGKDGKVLEIWDGNGCLHNAKVNAMLNAYLKIGKMINIMLYIFYHIFLNKVRNNKVLKHVEMCQICPMHASFTTHKTNIMALSGQLDSNLTIYHGSQEINITKFKSVLRKFKLLPQNKVLCQTRDDSSYHLSISD